jgi:hypothetical protein
MGKMLTKKYGETLDKVFKDEDNTSSIEIFIYVLGGELVSYTNFTRTRLNDYTRFNINTPDIDGYMFVKSGLNVEFIKIGDPLPQLFIYDTRYGGTFNQYDMDGNEISNGNLISLGNNFYTVGLLTMVKSFYDVPGKVLAVLNPENYVSEADVVNGTIRIQRDAWQFIAIPKEGKVKDIFIDKFAEQAGEDITELIVSASSYRVDKGKYLTYLPGFTLENGEHNFDLTFQDMESKELCPILLKTKAWTHTTDDIVYSYRE